MSDAKSLYEQREISYSERRNPSASREVGLSAVFLGNLHGEGAIRVVTFVLGCETQILSKNVVNEILRVARLGEYRLEFWRVLIASVAWDRREVRPLNCIGDRTTTRGGCKDKDSPFQNCSGSETVGSISHRARSSSGVACQSTHPVPSLYGGRLEMQNVLEAGEFSSTAGHTVQEI